MKFLIDESPLVVQPTLAKHLGLNKAIVLQQLNYWLSNPKAGVWHDGYKWIHNTYEEWQANFPFWSIDTVKRTLLSLEDDKIVVSGQFAPSSYDKTKSYRIDEAVLATVLDAICTEEKGNLPQSIQRLHTETTTDIPVTVVPDNYPLEFKIAAGVQVTSLPKDNEMLKVSEVIAKSFKDNHQLAVDILMAFQKTRGITFLYEEQKTHKTALNILIKAGVRPQHVVEAVKYNLSKNLACANLYSIKSKAIELANPAPSSGPKKVEGGYVSPKVGL